MSFECQNAEWRVCASEKVPHCNECWWMWKCVKSSVHVHRSECCSVSERVEGEIYQSFIWSSFCLRRRFLTSKQKVGNRKVCNHKRSCFPPSFGFKLQLNPANQDRQHEFTGAKCDSLQYLLSPVVSSAQWKALLWITLWQKTSTRTFEIKFCGLKKVCLHRFVIVDPHRVF